MIVEFTIQNFRSIKNEQTLSMYAENKYNHHAGNLSFLENDLGILKTCSFFGSNASGKTNIILAFEALKSIITESGGWKDGDPIKNYEPYALSHATKNSPISFEIEFYVDGIRFNYQVKYDVKEIIFEKLDFFPSSRAANLFTRNSSTDWKSVKFGEHYKGGKRQIAFFANNSYLAKAGNTADSPEIIRKIFNFFRKNTLTMLANQTIGVLGWDQDNDTMSVMNAFLKKADLGISKFEFEQADDLPDLLNFPKEIPEAIRESIKREFSRKAIFYHATDDGELIKFESEKESMGTNNLFRLIPSIVKILKEGSVLFIDEIESSLHPHMAELIIKLFNDPIVNKNNAQMIFTTHNLSLMNSKFLRKDQVYLTSKSIKDGTIFSCLEEYDESLKDISPFSKWYDEGRLGAIPSINYRDISQAIIEAL